MVDCGWQVHYGICELGPHNNQFNLIYVHSALSLLLKPGKFYRYVFKTGIIMN